MDYDKIADFAHYTSIAINAASCNNSATSSTLEDYEVESNNSSQLVQDFLDSDFGDSKENALGKIYSAAMVCAQEKGLLPEMSNLPQVIAATVDDALIKTKAAYKVGTGEIGVEDAVELIVDHAEARALTVVDMAFESGAMREFATNGIIALAHAIPYVGEIVGPVANACKPIIESVVSFVEKPVRSFIKKGISFVSDTAKSVCKKAVSAVKTVLGKIKNFLP